MKKALFNTKIIVEEAKKTLSEDNVWISDYVFWKELWASVSLKDISPRRALYIFSIKWKEDFPQNFRVKINGKIFTPTQFPIIDACRDEILFHATTKMSQ